MAATAEVGVLHHSVAVVRSVVAGTRVVVASTVIGVVGTRGVRHEVIHVVSVHAVDHAASRAARMIVVAAVAVTTRAKLLANVELVTIFKLLSFVYAYIQQHFGWHDSSMVSMLDL